MNRINFLLISMITLSTISMAEIKKALPLL